MRTELDEDSFDKNMQRAITPSQLCGFFPMILRDGAYHPSVLMIIVSATICILFSILTLTFYVRDKGVSSENISLSKEINYLDMLLMNSVPLVSMYELLSSFDDHKKLLFDLKTTDRDLKKLGRLTEYTSNTRALSTNFGLALMTLLFRISKNLMAGMDFWDTVTERAYYFGLLSTVIVLVHRFTEMLAVVSSLFRSCCKEAATCSQDHLTGRARRLEELAYLHNRLHLCSSLFGDCHGVQVFVIVLCSFIIFVSELYKSYVLLKEPLGLTTWLALIVKQCWIGVVFNICFQIVKACRRCSNQVDRINVVFGFELLVVFIICFSKVVAQLYLIFSLKAHTQVHVIHEMILEVVVWLTFVFSVSISIIKCCDATIEKAKEFNSLLYQLMIDDKSNEISSNKKLRLHVAMKREVVFSACGFFNLDYTLVHSMIAAATTYLVILIQFGQPTPASSNVTADKGLPGITVVPQLANATLP